MVIFAYAGPEAVLPLTSLIAAMASVVILFGRAAFRYLAGIVRGARRPAHQAPATTNARKTA